MYTQGITSSGLRSEAQDAQESIISHPPQTCGEAVKENYDSYSQVFFPSDGSRDSIVALTKSRKAGAGLPPGLW